MGSLGVSGVIGIVGLGFIVYALIGFVTGRVSYSDENKRNHYITRSEKPQAYWITTLASLAGGLVLLGVAAFMFRR